MEQIDRFRVTLRKMAPSLYPYHEHPLRNAEGYLKELYIVLLCTVAQYDGEISDAKSAYLRRMMIGLGLPDLLDHYLRKLLQINAETAQEFVRTLSGTEWARNFIVDSLVLIGCSGELSDKSVMFTAELAEVLRIRREDLEFLSKLALVVLEQDEVKYWHVLTEKPKNFSMSLLYFLEGFCKKALIDVHEADFKTIYTGEVIINEELSITDKNTAFIDAEVRFGENGLLKVESSSLLIHGSRFFGSSNPITLHSIENIQIKKSVFQDFKDNRALTLSFGNTVCISETTFLNCSYVDLRYSILALGGAIYAETIQQMQIRNCTFDRCTTVSYSRQSRGAAVHLQTCRLVNIAANRFHHCNNFDSSNNVANNSVISHKVNEIVLQDNQFWDSVKEAEKWG